MPQLPDGTNAPASFSENGSAPSVEFAQYNPRTGEYFAPDGHMYKQTDLVTATTPRSWKDLVLNGSA
jgi:hypothetical protein